MNSKNNSLYDSKVATRKYQGNTTTMVEESIKSGEERDAEK